MTVSPNRIELHLLRVFDAVMQTRSVTLAAYNLGCTQPAVSNALNRLRDALGDPLFVRTAEGMMPTPWAEQIGGPIREAITQIRETLEHRLRFDPRAAERVFKIFMTDAGQLTMLPPLVQVAAAEAPQISIHTVQIPPLRMREAALENGDVDLAVGYFEDFEGPFHRLRLFTEEFVCVVRADHPTIRGELTLEQFLNARHLVYHPRGCGYAAREHLIDGVFQYHGARRNIAVQVTHFLGAWMMLAQSDLLLVIARRLAEICATLVPAQILAPPFPLPAFDVAQYWHERFHNDPGNRWLRNRIAALYNVERQAAVSSAA